jgi:hypothetical protein
VGLTEAYLRRLSDRARAAGLDHDRLAWEVADHLADSRERHERDGCDPAEAARLAIEGFGEPDPLVRDLVSSTKGGDMEAWTRRIVTAVGVAATAALFLVHTLPSSDPGDALRAVAGVTIAASGVAALVLLLTSWRRATLPPNLPRRGAEILMVASGVALGALVAWGAARADRTRFAPHVGARFYLASLAALALMAVLFAGRARMRETAGPVLILAGVLGMGLSGLPLGAWHPLAGIGAGEGDFGVAFIVTGWLLSLAILAAGPQGSGARARMGGWLTRSGERLAEAGGRMGKGAGPESPAGPVGSATV